MIIACLVSGGALLIGLAAAGALRNYSHSKLEKIVRDEARLRSVTSRVKHFDRFEISLDLFNAMMTALFIGSLVMWRHGTDDATESVAVTLFIGLAVILVGYGLLRAVIARVAEGALLRLLSIIALISGLLFPLFKITEAIGSFIGRSMGGGEDANEEDDAVEEILDAVAEGEAEGVLQQTAADYIENIIEFRDQVVRDVMTPRTSMICLADDANLETVVELLQSKGHSRIPLYRKNPDDVVGILYLKDVLRRLPEVRSGAVDMATLSREPVFVPETKQISELLKEFQAQKVQVAIVLDEFGGTSGLVTVEDIVEEIVGEIRDVFDTEVDVTDIHHIDDHVVEIDAKIPVAELNERLDLAIPLNGDYDTVGGYLSSVLGKVPEQGETLKRESVRFDVMEADERKVKRVRITTRPE